METLVSSTGLDDMVRAARRGDVAAFGAVVRRTQDGLVRAARALVGDVHEAEDAVQEAYVAAFGALRGLRDPGSFRAWIARILTRIALRRRRRPWPARLGDADARVPARPAADHGRLDALVEAVDALPAKYRAPVALHYLAELSYREVAEALGIPEKRVKSRLHDARERLRRRLDP
jgi:RNA polymerase sigma-70 factor (ECF subfamily)